MSSGGLGPRLWALPCPRAEPPPPRGQWSCCLHHQALSGRRQVPRQSRIHRESSESGSESPAPPSSQEAAASRPPTGRRDGTMMTSASSVRTLRKGLRDGLRHRQTCSSVHRSSEHLHLWTRNPQGVGRLGRRHSHRLCRRQAGHGADEEASCRREGTSVVSRTLVQRPASRRSPATRHCRECPRYRTRRPSHPGPPTHHATQRNYRSRAGGSQCRRAIRGLWACSIG